MQEWFAFIVAYSQFWGPRWEAPHGVVTLRCITCRNQIRFHSIISPAMIHFFLLVSRQGKCRLSKWYTPHSGNFANFSWFLLVDFDFLIIKIIRVFLRFPHFREQWNQPFALQIRTSKSTFVKFQPCVWAGRKSCATFWNGESTR
jgi:hypothetical protein